MNGCLPKEEIWLFERTSVSGECAVWKTKNQKRINILHCLGNVIYHLQNNVIINFISQSKIILSFYYLLMICER